MPLLPSERAAVATFGAQVRARFGPRLRELGMFGSRARGARARGEKGTKTRMSTCSSI
jgi:hypothetical protein